MRHQRPDAQPKEKNSEKKLSNPVLPIKQQTTRPWLPASAAKIKFPTASTERGKSRNLSRDNTPAQRGRAEQADKPSTSSDAKSKASLDGKPQQPYLMSGYHKKPEPAEPSGHF